MSAAADNIVLDLSKRDLTAESPELLALLQPPSEVQQDSEWPLKELHLFGNKITMLPPSFFSRLSMLEVLYLDGNGLLELPASIGCLTALQDLALHDNALTVLPAEICTLSALRHLRLDRNKLTELPADIGKLTSLQTLHLDGNELALLPSSMGEMAALADLFIGSNPPLTHIPVELSKCTSLILFYGVEGQSYENLPAAVIEAGAEAVRAHLAKQLSLLAGEICLF